MEALVDLGLLDEKTKLPYLDPSAPKITWADFMTKFLDPKGQSGKTPEQLVKDHLRPPAGFPSLGFEIDKLNRVIEAFDFLGFFSTTNYVHQKHTCLDALCPLLENVLAFDHKVDWDAVIMHHIVDAEFPNGQTERHNMTFSAYGKIGGPSAISLTVGLAVAIAADLVLDGTITSRGVLGPMKPDIFVPVMKALKDEGFRFVHRVKSFPTSQNVIA
jgi:saccharopine dehydrogenase-like NADP-dependent oxidoreductase